MSTPTPPATEAILLMAEPQFCYAVESILKDAGFASSGVIFLPGSSSDLPDESVTVKFVRGAATGAQCLKPDGQIEYSQFTGTLTLVYALRRDQNTASTAVGLLTRLDEKVGLIRQFLQKSAKKFTLGKLPWLAVTDIVPGASERGVDRDRDRDFDVAIERFTLTYEIRPEAWPR